MGALGSTAVATLATLHFFHLQLSLLWIQLYLMYTVFLSVVTATVVSGLSVDSGETFAHIQSVEESCV